MERQLHVMHLFVQQIFPENLTGAGQGARPKGAGLSHTDTTQPVTIWAGRGRALHGRCGEGNRIPDLMEPPTLSDLCFVCPANFPSSSPSYLSRIFLYLWLSGHQAHCAVLC